MTKKPDLPGVSRRDFLSASALPLAAAAMIPAVAMAQTTTSGARAGSSARSRKIRIGIIGAGNNLQNVQIPGFRKIPECEIVAVANRSLESSKRVTDKFGIAKPYANWRDLLDDKEIDAVSIGTPPYMHRTMTLAALESGKHVLTQARMANNVAEAREMLAAAQRYPRLVTQIVPMSQSYWQDNLLKKMIWGGDIGEVLSVDAQRVQTTRRQLTGEGGFADEDGELSFRQSTEESGYNALSVGQTYEEISRWAGLATRVMAMSKVQVPYRKTPEGQMVSISVPDHIDVLYELVNNAQVHLRISAISGLSTGNYTWIYGTKGTIYTNQERKIFFGKAGDDKLAEVPNPREAQARYRVEEEFINAIRGIEEVKMNTFEMGVQNIEFVEAVYRSSKTGQAVYLPM